MIDTHCHLNTDKFSEDFIEVLKRAKDSGVEKIIIPAIEPNDFDGLLKIVDENPEIYCGIGIHPHNVANKTYSDLEKVESLLDNNKVIAVGEIGIDYFYDFAPKEKQKEMFDSQIKIAKNNNLPIIVHNREADDDVLDIIKSNQNGDLKGVLHCFSSNIETLKKTLDLGFNVSFTGNITFKKVDLDDVIKFVPLDRFMIETDSPYMAPVPHRGKRNEPSFVRFVAEKIAEIKNMSFNEIVKLSTENANKLFRLSLILLFLFSSSNILAQDDVYYEDEEEEFEELYLQEYDKLFGIGVMLGTTTIVESRFLDEGTQTISYEGFLGYGGELVFTPFNSLQFKFGYVYAKNDKVVQDARNQGIPESELPAPNIHQMLELTANYIPNPLNRINFFVTGGANLFLNDINTEKNQRLGITFGVGVTGNLWESPWGLLAFNGEFRVNVELGKENYDDVYIETRARDDIRDNVPISNLYSMPRATIVFFPKFR